MKFQIDTQEFNYLINKAQNIISLKPSIPILNNLLIEARDDELILTATDLTVSIQCTAEVRVLEEGSTTLPAKKLAQLVREITAPVIEFSCGQNNIASITAGASHFKLNGMDKSSYPEWPNLSDLCRLTLDQSALKDLLYRTSFAISKEENRYVLTGLFIKIEGGLITAIGTDGKKLAKAHAPIKNGPSLTTQAVIPFKAIDEILKNLREEGEATLSLMEDRIILQADDTLLIAKLLSGDYPDVWRVIPTQPTMLFSLHREELIAVLRQVSLFLTDTQRSARFHFANGELLATANTADVGEGIASMPVNTQGHEIEVAFNPGYFLDILRHCKGETVLLGLTDAHNPGVIIEGGNEASIGDASPLFVIMPMRLADG